MANTSLNEISFLIKQQVAFQEDVQEQLTKAAAIANVALSEDFLDFEQSVIHSYLLVLCDIISTAKDRQEFALNNLLKNGGLYNNELKTS